LNAQLPMHGRLGPNQGAIANVRVALSAAAGDCARGGTAAVCSERAWWSFAQRRRTGGLASNTSGRPRHRRGCSLAVAATRATAGAVDVLVVNMVRLCPQRLVWGARIPSRAETMRINLDGLSELARLPVCGMCSAASVGSYSQSTAWPRREALGSCVHCFQTGVIGLARAVGPGRRAVRSQSNAVLPVGCRSGNGLTLASARESNGAGHSVEQVWLERAASSAEPCWNRARSPR